MNFFEQHGILTLLCLAFFPRLTLLIASFATGGLLWWLGWFFAPHVLVAFLSLPYWDSNPVLVVIAWLIAFSGTGTEAAVVKRPRRRK